MKEDALACLSLSYKYVSLIDCVSGQRPRLLADSKLQRLLDQKEMIEQLFKDRLEEIAYGDGATEEETL
jgi:hypothetical protein